MNEIFRDNQEQIDTFYKCALRLMIEDYKKMGLTIEQADELYDRFNIITMFKNGKVDFTNERD